MVPGWIGVLLLFFIVILLSCLIIELVKIRKMLEESAGRSAGGSSGRPEA